MSLLRNERAIKGARALRRLLYFWPAVGVVVTLGGAFAVSATNETQVGGLLAPLREGFFDHLIRNRAPRVLDGPDSPIVIVGYDERSSQAFGNQIPRGKVADLLTRLSGSGAKVAAIDILFAEKDPASEKISRALAELGKSIDPPPPDLEKTTDEIRGQFDDDARLAAALHNLPMKIIEAYAEVPADHHSSDWKKIPDTEKLDAQGCEHAGMRTDILVDTPRIFDAANYHANAYVSPDTDGVVRRYPLFAHIQQDPSPDLYPSLALMAAQHFTGWEMSPQLDCKGTAVSGFSLDTTTLTDVVDGDGLVRVDFAGSFSQSFPHYVPFVDALARHGKEWQIPDKVFKDKIVFIGRRDDNDDRYTTPFDTVFSGVGFHATVARSLVKGEWLRRLSDTQPKEALGALLLGLLGVLAIVVFPRFWTLLVAVGLTFAGYRFSVFMLSRGYLVNGLFPGFVATTAMLAAFSSRFFLEQARADDERERAEDEKKQREATQRELGRFLSPAIVDIALRDPNLLAPAKRDISILFSDIRGFTTTAEGMTPEALASLLEGYLTRMTQIVFDEKGTLDKYIGDAVMALFGAPVAYDDHPRYACLCALAMMKALAEMRVEWAATGQPILDIGVGVNTGVVSVGRMGSRGKSEYTCLGDEVNFASRLEGLNKAYGTHILVGESTRNRAGAEFLFRDLGSVQVKGKKKASRVFELLGQQQPGEVPPIWLPVWDKGLNSFLQREWSEAERLFHSVADTRGGDPAAQAFLEYIEVFRVHPPPRDWQGTMERNTK